MIAYYDGTSLVDISTPEVYNGTELIPVDVFYFDGVSLVPLADSGAGTPDPGDPTEPPPPSGVFPSFFPTYANTSGYSTTTLTTSATAADVNTAFGSFKRVLLPGGTYNFGSSRVAGSDNILEGIDGQVINIEFNSGVEDVIRLTNTTGESWKELGCSTVSAGSKTISGISNTSNLSVGMNIVMRSNDIFNPKRSQYHTTAEYCKVASKTSNTVTLEKPLEFSYNNTPKVRYKTSTRPTNIGVKNVTISINGSGSAVSSLILIEGAEKAFVEGCRLLGDSNERAKRGITFDNCIQTHCYDSEASRISHEDDQGPFSSRQGYPLYHYSCYSSYVWNFYSTRGKHAVDMDSRSGESQQMFTYVYNTTVENQLLQGLSSHGGTYKTEWVDCTVINSWGGYLFRQGKGYITVKRCKFLLNQLPLPLPWASGTSRPYWINSKPACDSVMQFGEGLNSGGVGDPNDGNDAHNVLVEDFEVDATRVSNGVNNKASEALVKIFVNSKNFIFRASDQSLRMSSKNMSGWASFAGHAILVQGNTIQSTSFSSLGFDLTGQPSNRYLCYVTNGSKSGISLTDITVKGASLPNQPVGGSGSGASSISNITYVT